MNTIITIGRQYGSGGREVGQKLAAHYGINFYDNELITKVAKESGFCQEFVQQQDERPTNSFLYNLVMDTYSFGFSGSGFSDMPISQKVFLAQYDTIKKIAKEEGACVIIGRCADCALQDFSNVINARCRISPMSSMSFSTRAKSFGSPGLRSIPMCLQKIRPIPTNCGITFFARTSRDRVITIIIP